MNSKLLYPNVSWLLIALAVLWLGASWSSAATLQGIRFWQHPQYSRVVLQLNGPCDYKPHFLPAQGPHPPRLYVDLPQVEAGSGVLERTQVDGRLIKAIRRGQPQPRTQRVVLDLAHKSAYEVFHLPNPYRVVLDLKSGAAAGSASGVPESSSQDHLGRILQRDMAPQSQVALPQKQNSGLDRIVLDPGHGGKDPGAVGPDGAYEKDVVLPLTRKLAAELRRRLPCEVMLTRTDDTFIPLKERTAIANRKQADLFVSIHANANRNASVYGIETYFLNFSKSDKALSVAARENNTSLEKVNDLEMILLDLMANAKLKESSCLAGSIQRAMVAELDQKYSYIKDHGVRQGPFYVLLGATMPSVLVEVGYMSHPREGKRLQRSGYQKNTAAAIATGICRYVDALNLLAQHKD